MFSRLLAEHREKCVEIEALVGVEVPTEKGIGEWVRKKAAEGRRE